MPPHQIGPGRKPFDNRARSLLKHWHVEYFPYLAARSRAGAGRVTPAETPSPPKQAADRLNGPSVAVGGIEPFGIERRRADPLGSARRTSDQTRRRHRCWSSGARLRARAAPRRLLRRSVRAGPHHRRPHGDDPRRPDTRSTTARPTSPPAASCSRSTSPNSSTPAMPHAGRPRPAAAKAPPPCTPGTSARPA